MFAWVNATWSQLFINAYQYLEPHLLSICLELLEFFCPRQLPAYCLLGWVVLGNIPTDSSSSEKTSAVTRHCYSGEEFMLALHISPWTLGSSNVLFAKILHQDLFFQSCCQKYGLIQYSWKNPFTSSFYLYRQICNCKHVAYSSLSQTIFFFKIGITFKHNSAKQFHIIKRWA